VAAAQLHRHRPPGRRDVEAFDAEIAGLEVEAGDRRRAARHRPEGDGPALRPAGLDPDALVVLARHDEDGVARVGRVGRVLNGLKGLVLRSRVRVGLAGGRLLNHVRGRSKPAQPCQPTRPRTPIGSARPKTPVLASSFSFSLSYLCYAIANLGHRPGRPAAVGWLPAVAILVCVLGAGRWCGATESAQAKAGQVLPEGRCLAA